ncbi:MAG TPA: hypothetical protein VD905_19650 [Flavobacteriales bacterium]|nr:hypothetical protein [Flavobacteriales bacterium]
MREKFEQNKVNLLQRYLQQQAEKNASRYFEIYVDNLKVVPKTNDVNEFETYHEFITPDTKLLKILIYSTSATSPRNEPHYYYFADENPVQPAVQTLSGVEIDQRLSEKISAERQKWEADQQAKEFSETRKKLSEAEEYIEKLESQLSEYKGKKLHWGDVNLGELASVMLEGFVRRNPQLLAKLPGGENLAGIIEMDNKEKLQISQQPVAEASFSKKSDEVSAEHGPYIQLLKQLETCFSQGDLNTVMKILGVLIEQPQHLPTVADLLGIN